MKKPRCGAAIVLAAALSVADARIADAQLAGATLFRIFLKDGTAIASYGEYARVGERVVFSLPVGRSTESPSLQLMSLAAGLVDWDRTARYADAARYERYVATSGEADFAELASEVARVLNEIGLTKDPSRRLKLAEGARRTLAEWPRLHFGYRSSDVADLAALFDETIAELRSDRSGASFNLSLVATIEPPSTKLLDDPTPADMIDQAVVVARLSDVPAERISLQQAILAALEGPLPSFSPDWIDRTRSVVGRELRDEMRIETGYANLSATLVPKASRLAARADVSGVAKVLADLQRRDEELGGRRPDQMAGVRAAIEASLESARHLRLRRDRWSQRIETYRTYWRTIRPAADQLAEAADELDAIRTLAGPDPSTLSTLTDRLARVARILAFATVPSELAPVHATLESASHLAGEAVRIRRQAINLADLPTAWNASAAAAGSVMLFRQARSELDSLLKPPEGKQD